MIISLVAVLGLQGMENQLVFTNFENETVFKKAFFHCLTRRPMFNEHTFFKNSLVVCCFDGPEKIQLELLNKVIDDEGKKIKIDQESATTIIDVQLYSTVKTEEFNEKIKIAASSMSELSFMWKENSIDKMIVYNIDNIADENLTQALENIKELIDKNNEQTSEQISLLVTTPNSAYTVRVLKALENMKVFRSQGEFNVSFEGFKAYSDSELKKQQPGLISKFRAFFTTHRVKLAAGGFSLAALFAYYYKFVR
jgi:hypothetical protein